MPAQVGSCGSEYLFTWPARRMTRLFVCGNSTWTPDLKAFVAECYILIEKLFAPILTSSGFILIRLVGLRSLY